ncbi:Rap1a/Tai family immunity protein [Enterobacter sp. 118C5]|uniref:Rap1a/Tai family immunity protein n=1 Tax=Enterobacter TaxID=547 RepID=UPI002A80093E|nr:hypothetical protein [Enterobacter sp. 118C5]
MIKNLLIATSLLAVSALASAQPEKYTYPRAEALPQDDTSNMMRDPALLTGYDLNLTAERFANAWLSKTNERERIKANMYLLGVVDASEGTVWCKGKPFLPNTLHEFLYPRFANLTAEQKEERASKIITDGMKELRPCKKESDK